MQAFRNVGGVITEITVDIGLDDQPILPPDTTVEPRPEALEGHYVTVVGNSWVQIPIPEEVISFETKKAQTLQQLNEYKEWLQEQNIEFNGVVFQANALTRDRVTQTFVAYRELGYLPPAWIAADNTPYALNSIDDFAPLAHAIMNTFTERFYEANAIRTQIMAAVDMAELSQVRIPGMTSTI